MPSGSVGRIGWRPRPPGPGSAGPAARQPLVSGSAMGPGLGQQLRLGLESVPRLARSGSGGLGPLGAAAAVGAAASTCTGVGAAGPLDVEPHRRELGILQQRRVDAGLAPAVACSPTPLAGRSNFLRP